MPPSDKIDTQFLKGTVAAVLVRACSECAVARPDDPVQFVAGWLDKYVQNDGILMKHAISKTAAEEDAEAAATVRCATCVYREGREWAMYRAIAPYPHPLKENKENIASSLHPHAPHRPH